MQKILEHAGIYVERDEVGAGQLRVDARVQWRCDRFAKFQEYVAKTLQRHPRWLGCCLVCFDGVLGEPALNKACTALAQAYRLGTEVAIEWQEERPQRIERRLLSKLTCMTLPAAGSSGLGGNELALQMQQCLDIALYESQLYQGEKHARQQMWADAACWYLMCLPMALSSHLLEIQVISGLSRAALARKATQKVLAVEVPEESDIEVMPRALTAAELAPTNSKDASAMNQLDAILARSGQLSDAQQRKRWTAQLGAVIAAEQRSGFVSCLILAWALDLTENGTPFKPNPAASTIQRYIRSVMWPLWDVFSNCETSLDEEISLSTLKECYDAVWIHPKFSQSEPSRQALSSWHKFLVRELNVPSLRGTDIGEEIDGSVDAQVIWPHEKLRVLELLRSLSTDERLAKGSEVFFMIACHGAFRQNEVARLRVANVRSEDDGVDIEVVASRSHGRLKSQAAQRRVRISAPQACATIRAWVRRRNQEMASGDDLLFADPNSAAPKIYRHYAMLGLINKALKRATGDLGASIHGLRHTFLSEAAIPLLCSTNLSSRNRLWELANEAGHASPVTTITNYVHQYEQALRIHLDQGLSESIVWDSVNAANLLGIKAATLRKQKQRLSQEQSSLYQLVQTQLQERAEQLEILGVDHGLSMLEYQAQQLDVSQPQMSIPVLLQVLQAMLEQQPIEAIELRHQLSQATRQAIEKAAQAVCDELLRNVRQKQRGGFSKESARKNWRIACAFLDIDLKKRSQHKYFVLEDFCFSWADQSFLKTVSCSWMNSYCGRYLSLEEPSRDEAVLRWLYEAGVSSQSLHIRVAKGFDVEALTTVWQAVFGEKPYVQTCPLRSDRPKAYLVWSEKPNQALPVSPAAGAVSGAVAWLFGVATWFFLQLKESQDA